MKGIQEIQGPKGDKGDGVSSSSGSGGGDSFLTGVIGGVAGATLSLGAIVTLDALNAGLSGLENTLNPQILELQAKTQNQNALPLNTTFSGQLTISPSTLITSSITLNPDSQNYIPNTTNFYDINTQNITNSLALTTNSLTTDKLSIDGNVNTSLNFGSTTNSYRECGIDYSSQIGTTANDLGSMNIPGQCS